MTPAQVRQSGAAGYFDKAQAAEALGDCLERRIRNLNGEFTTFRTRTSSGQIELGVQMPDYGTVALLDIVPNSGPGSHVRVYVNPQMFKDKEKQAAGEFVAGC